jgi:hypothetical protein
MAENALVALEAHVILLIKARRWRIRSISSLPTALHWAEAEIKQF